MREKGTKASIEGGGKWLRAIFGGITFGAMMIGGSAISGNLNAPSVMINVAFAALMVVFLGAILPRMRRP